MYSHSSFRYPKLKAAALLLSLCLMMVGSCPIQKYLAGAFSIEVEDSKQPAVRQVVKNSVSCTNNKEVIYAPLAEASKTTSASGALFFLFLGTSIYSLIRFLTKEWGKGVKEKDPILTAVPLFVRNQVFRI